MTGNLIINYRTAKIKNNIGDNTSIYSSTLYTNSSNVNIISN